ncbi:MAG: hypothetical protein PHY90_10590 [Desulfitobacteriaceae bacterium]|nr:hypothetical protein [Desulfitobacteriaceae bacterium]
MKVSKYILFALAGSLWTFAGSMVLSMGLPALIKCWTWYWQVSAIVVFLVFYVAVFSVLVRKHEQRIQNDERDKMPIWLFFDLKSYLIMAIMMTSGVVLRMNGILPQWFLAFFYSGLGSALLSCGVYFIVIAVRYSPLRACFQTQK